MFRAWKIYTGNPVDPSCLTLQSGLPSPLSLLAEVEARETPDIISYLPSYGYLFCTLWADTAAVQRNIFICQGQVLLVFSYNKASQSSNNSFFIVRVPCAVVGKCLFLYLAYIRPFSDFLSRQLKVVSATVPTNPYLFTAYDTPSACFSSAACSKMLQQSTRECPILLHFQVYRQIVVAISKKHLPSIAQSFDANTPRDYDGLLQLLSFQTGHNPATHAGAYALDRAYPAKLQPGLVERYFQASRVWHQFLGITEEGSIVVDIGSDVNQPSSEATWCAPSGPPHQFDRLFTRTNVSSEDDTVLQERERAVEEAEAFGRGEHESNTEKNQYSTGRPRETRAGARDAKALQSGFTRVADAGQ
jgi:hypothetical protein